VVAVIVTAPAPTPVTGTATLVEPAVNVTVDGTVAKPVFVDAGVTVNAVGAAAERVRMRLFVDPAFKVSVAGENALVPPVVTTWTTPVPVA
jgi:hypothetical protein